jgi:predicted HicB family RNase H-like nuclease
MKQINIRIQDQTYALLKEKSKQQRISMNRLVDYFVSEGLSENVVKKVIQG